MFTAQKMIRRKKNVKKGIQFCLMVCGASGTGKSPLQRGCTAPDALIVPGFFPTGRTTFVNTLCGKTVLAHKDCDDATTAPVEEGVKIKPVTVGTHSPQRRQQVCSNGR
jgi:cell division control protein 11